MITGSRLLYITSVYRTVDYDYHPHQHQDLVLVKNEQCFYQAALYHAVTIIFSVNNSIIWHITGTFLDNGIFCSLRFSVRSL